MWFWSTLQLHVLHSSDTYLPAWRMRRSVVTVTYYEPGSRARSDPIALISPCQFDSITPNKYYLLPYCTTRCCRTCPFASSVHQGTCTVAECYQLPESSRLFCLALFLLFLQAARCRSNAQHVSRCSAFLGPISKSPWNCIFSRGICAMRITYVLLPAYRIDNRPARASHISQTPSCAPYPHTSPRAKHRYTSIPTWQSIQRPGPWGW